ncbi:MULTISPECIES: TrkH family potassium uptake protein [unclassified Rhodosalinus]|uniref:TrkH family potassium uptake protein n=1 Tax=unclassified Rhodosalinus TaxID=2630183 RepID=UPI003526A1DF
MGRLYRLPLLLLLTGVVALSMYLPAGVARVDGDHHVARTFFYAGTLGLILVTLVAVARWGRPPERDTLRQLLSLLGVFTLLPAAMAIPFHEAVRTTSFLNAYVEMVSCLTTTGATLFEDPGRLVPALHLWRAQVGWLGGLLIWVAAASILAPLNLGGFEVTASAEPGQGEGRQPQMHAAAPATRLARATAALAPVYVGLTGALWVMLMIMGETTLPALVHAMSVMSTSGISATGGLEVSGAGRGGEMVIFLFLFFALSRLTFSSDTIATQRTGLHNDPEFRLGLLIVLGVPLVLFLRHWLGAFDFGEEENLGAVLRALWGAIFTVLSYLTTTGFMSADWDAAQNWSGLETTGLILLGLALVGGGVATTAGGVKLLRVYALYLNGMREVERLVHPSSVGRASVFSRRLRRRGAFVAWIFFMLFALSLALVTVVFAALGSGFEEALVLTIAALSTTGPLVTSALETPISLAMLPGAAKLVFCAAMVLGRFEMLAIIALITPELWRR